VGAPLWSKLSDADKKSFTEVFREAAARAGAEIVDSEKKLVGEFEKRGKTVVRVDRKPFIAAVQKYYKEGKQPDGSALPWGKDVFDKLQAIK
jgi:TRAP-type C4-dicarboxylate transport system substrate-binding protein